MNAAHWHLALNHHPVVGMAFATLLLAFALLRKRSELYGVCLGAFVVIALLSIPVYLTGEPAEMLLMDIGNVDEDLVKAHEKIATIAFSGIVLIGVGSLASLFVWRKAPQPPRWLAAVVLGLALLVSGLLGWTANLGGHISHPETRSAPAAGKPAGKTHE